MITRLVQRFPRLPWKDLGAGSGLLLLAGVLLTLSWRKWSDAQIDFGRELYLPWRIAEGAVFGRDIESLYGPLSAYVNGAWFKLWGASLGNLIALNLLLYAVILGLLYDLLRRGWGTAGAAVGGAFFILVFSFSQLVGIGNYNYVTPYSHEATHGVLACLVTAWALLRWRRTGGAGSALIAGLGVGACVLLKIECLVAAVGICGVAAILQWRAGGGFGRAALALFALGAVGPLVGFTLFLLPDLGWSDAFVTAGQTLFNALGTARYTAEKVQFTFSGFDDPWTNLGRHLLSSGLFAAGAALLLWGARRATAWLETLEQDSYWQGMVLVALATGAAGAYWGPAHFGQTLLLASLALAGLAGFAWERARRDSAPTALIEARLILALLGAALLLRMLLNGRLQHYGFYQAAIAGSVVLAALWVELPAAARSRGQRLLQVAVAAFALGLAGKISTASNSLYRVKTLPIGEGSDRTWHFPPAVDGRPELQRAALEWITKNVKPGERLLVLPEGIMLNFLSRTPTPLRTTHFFAGALVGGREAGLVEQLERDPPKWVVLVSRDLREYGVGRYGESIGHGQLLVEWVQRRYEQVASAGDDPLIADKIGVRAFQLRTAASSSTPSSSAP